MKSQINQELRAFYAWRVLTKFAQNRNTLTYSELAINLNIHHRAVRFILDIIYEYCLINAIPMLTIIVINKATNLPGEGFVDYEVENFDDYLDEVFDYPWNPIPNPFTYAENGMTQNLLIKQILKDPQNSHDVYVLVKARGISQFIFRKALMSAFDSKCAICGISYYEALEAAHIIPYSQSTFMQRLDVRNGLLLCSIHHKLFDSGYVNISQDYLVQIWDFEQKKRVYGNTDLAMVMNFHGKKLLLPAKEIHYPSLEFIKKHN